MSDDRIEAIITAQEQIEDGIRRLSSLSLAYYLKKLYLCRQLLLTRFARGILNVINFKKRNRLSMRGDKLDG